MNLAGKHLWLVKLTGGSINLWISTHKKDVALAVSKAKTFMNRDRKFDGAEIDSVEYEGTIDA